MGLLTLLNVQIWLRLVDSLPQNATNCSWQPEMGESHGNLERPDTTRIAG